MIAFFFLFLLNLFISYWNAKTVGKAWVETKHAGGWPRFMAWMGALGSASGFTWCYLIVLVLGAAMFGKLTPRYVEAAFSLGYLVVIPGVLLSGLMITLDSWARAYRQHTLANVGIAGYDSFAQLYNTYHAIDGIGDALSNIAGTFLGDRQGGGDGDSGDAVWVIVLVLLATSAGILTTAVIINRAAASADLKTVTKRARAAQTVKGAATRSVPAWLIGGALAAFVIVLGMSCVAMSAVAVFLVGELGG
jgi:hypothetical protein